MAGSPSKDFVTYDECLAEARKAMAERYPQLPELTLGKEWSEFCISFAAGLAWKCAAMAVARGNCPEMHDGAGQLVSQEAAALAVKSFAELWGNCSFDCGPQDYEFMSRELETRVLQSRLS